MHYRFWSGALVAAPAVQSVSTSAPALLGPRAPPDTSEARPPVAQGIPLGLKLPGLLQEASS
jgi:hypothetical protein